MTAQRPRADRLYACDPVCTDAPPEGIRSVALEAVTELDVDAIVLTTAHDAFEGIDWEEFEEDRKSTRLNSSHIQKSRMPSSA